jgi:pyruvate dehydrogenase E1 component alpha subunit/2-oxoisovalerate dehydrogenase E1 component alpha subunit
MRRYKAYDPPEYVSFRADPALVKEYGQTLRRDGGRLALVEALSRDTLLSLYAGMLRFRLHDIMLKRWVRQGVLSKAWLGTGEEAVSVGCVHALQPGDSVAPMIRNAGACHEMGMSLADLFRAYMGTADSLTQGRDLHIGDLSKGVIAPISHVGSLVPVCAGVALSYRLTGRKQVALTWAGDGTTRTAEFHEGLNFAAVRRLPLVVVVQNNQCALGTATSVHTRPGVLAELHQAYGALGLTADGNNVLDVYAATRLLAQRARQGEGAAVLLANTFRMGGHATHDEREARQVLPAELFAHWGARDPIGLYEAWLEQEGHADQEALAEIEQAVNQQVEEQAAEALASRDSHPAEPWRVSEGVWSTAPAE